MLLFEITGTPTPFAHHAGNGKKSFNPKHKENEYARWQLKAQYNQKTPITCPIHLQLDFHMPIPTATSKIRRLQMLNGKIHHISRPDTSNLVKFAEDTLKGIIIEDDSQVYLLTAQKLYSETPKTVIRIYQPDSPPS